MKSFQVDTDQILAEAIEVIENISSFHELEMVKSTYLGKKGKLTNILRQLVDAEESERPKIGQAVNLVKEKIINLIDARGLVLKTAEVEANLKSESIDITLPPRGQALGSLHPITKVRRILEDFFVSRGFIVVEGPEIESEFYNFSALNVPIYHPARSPSDTFYFDNNMLLRTQTSPVQIRAMQKMQPPLRIICPGKVFRRDSDATHSPMFHQLEMLIVDENVNFANLKWIISEFIKYFFKEKVEYRFRPSYFPF